VIVGVGGSASTDGGLAAVDALGWSLHHVPVTVACDVSVPFVDAARRFGPQKGATSAQLALLTRRLEQLADQYLARTGVDVRTLTGAGAAGGLAGGLAALGATLEPGFEVVARAAGLDELLAEDVDLVITGEGKLDATSFLGKTVGGVLEWATDDEIPHLAVIAGEVTPEAREEAEVYANLQVLALTDRVWQAGEAFARAGTLVEEAAYEAATAALAERARDDAER
jgi:glycerate kinase